MSNIAVGGIKLNGLNPKQTIGSPNDTSNIQLKGINFNNQANVPQQQTVNPNWNNDAAKVNQPSYGTVPANDDLPELFTQDVPQTNTVPKVRSAVVADPNLTNKDKGMITGIGMAIGAVTLGFIGSKIAPGAAGTFMGLGAKLGIGLGLIAGGIVGNQMDK